MSTTKESLQDLASGIVTARTEIRAEIEQARGNTELRGLLRIEDAALQVGYHSAGGASVIGRLSRILGRELTLDEAELGEVKVHAALKAAPPDEGSGTSPDPITPTTPPVDVAALEARHRAEIEVMSAGAVVGVAPTALGDFTTRAMAAGFEPGGSPPWSTKHPGQRMDVGEWADSLTDTAGHLFLPSTGGGARGEPPHNAPSTGVGDRSDPLWMSRNLEAVARGTLKGGVK